jgi:hypothetical protein
MKFRRRFHSAPLIVENLGAFHKILWKTRRLPAGKLSPKNLENLLKKRRVCAIIYLVFFERTECPLRVGEGI